MTANGSTDIDNLRRLVYTGRISQQVLVAATGIPAERLERLLAGTPRETHGLVAAPALLSPDESMRLSLLTAKLIAGLPVNDDERLTGIVETLIEEFGLSLQQLSHLVEVDPEDIEGVLSDPAAVPSETKYHAGLRCSYLLYALAEARGHEEAE